MGWRLLHLEQSPNFVMEVKANSLTGLMRHSRSEAVTGLGCCLGTGIKLP